MNITEQIAATHLGKRSEGSELYDKSLLVAVPRSDNRSQYGIEEENLPFVGYDVWNAYEVSFMTTQNVPCNYVLKIRYPATSPYIVESKSLKLYLNSFNMTPLKATVEASKNFFLQRVREDLSALLKTEVDVVLHKSYSKGRCKMLRGYKPLDTLISMDEVTCSKFKESPEELGFCADNAGKKLKISFSALRSNCRVTHQPDFGDLFVYIQSPLGVDLKGLVRYLVSFRKEFHFHEECVEMIYKRLMDKYHPKNLMVTALYTRRGGIDINPTRASSESLLDKELLDINRYTKRTAKQ